ncbi:hypothetical protein KSP40_PGU020356 [Platanthera guangdongensis]|uniref:Uncharacterized protein n=1 Tax=Platanthera guangdongensis TaxID=2320717 RepID=A0ABR2MQE8_9ASPA
MSVIVYILQSCGKHLKCLRVDHLCWTPLLEMDTATGDLMQKATTLRFVCMRKCTKWMLEGGGQVGELGTGGLVQMVWWFGDLAVKPGGSATSRLTDWAWRFGCLLAEWFWRLDSCVGGLILAVLWSASG